MFTLVIGGAASGKSEYAEGLVLASSHFPRYYIATMEPFDEECRRRVEKHRRMRANKRFETVECYINLSSVRLPERGTVLLECVGNLAANELYSPRGAGNGADALSAIIGGVDETAAVLFPDACQIVVPDFREMDFGIFEGRSAAEMSGDPAYRQWVDGFCQGPVPGGESKDSFSRRTCRAFAALLDAAADRGEDSLAIVAHGGTQMAALERYALPRRDYYAWQSPYGGGFVLDASRWTADRTLTLLRTVQYTKGGTL